MRSQDGDWTALTELWHEQGRPPEPDPELVRRVRRHTRAMILVTAAEVLVLAGLAAFTVVLLRRGIDGAQAVLLALLWGLAVAAEVFALLNRRGSWRADAADAASYLVLAERRARAKLRVARAVIILALAQACVLAALLASLGSRPAVAVAWTAGVASLYVAWAVWYGRGARRELADLTRARALSGKPAEAAM